MGVKTSILSFLPLLVYGVCTGSASDVHGWDNLGGAVRSLLGRPDNRCGEVVREVSPKRGVKGVKAFEALASDAGGREVLREK